MPVLFLAIASSVQGSGTAAAENDYRIASPTTDEPQKVEPGGILHILVRLRLPLTPPPGVQQPKAREGWKVTFASRSAVAADSGPGGVTYPSYLIRIRPAGGEFYRFSVELAPWMLPGVYDLCVDGPEFAGRQPRAVLVGRQSSDERRGLEIDRVDASAVSIRNLLQQKATLPFDLIVPARVPGLAVEINRARAAPSGVAWAAPPAPGEAVSRVLRFEVDVPAAKGEEPGRALITWTSVEDRACEARIEISGHEGRIDPMSSTELLMEAEEFDPIGIIWDLGDGAWAVGKRARHRFITSDDVEIGAAAFDRFARVCRASVSERMALPVERSGCSCGFIGAK